MRKPRQELLQDKPVCRLPISATLANVALSIPEDPILRVYEDMRGLSTCDALALRNVMTFLKNEVYRA